MKKGHYSWPSNRLLPAARISSVPINVPFARIGSADMPAHLSASPSPPVQLLFADAALKSSPPFVGPPLAKVFYHHSRF